MLPFLKLFENPLSNILLSKVFLGRNGCFGLLTKIEKEVWD